jgi:superfamily I DNA/RNA helicase
MKSQVRNILVVAFNKHIALELNTKLANWRQRQLPAPTNYQTAILDFLFQYDSNLHVAALAGTGKSTAIEQAVHQALRIFPNASIRAATLHSVCYKALCYYLRTNKNINNVEVDEDKIPTTARQLLNYDQMNADEQARADQIVGPVRGFANIARAHLFTSVKPEPTNDDLYMLADRYDIDLPDPNSGIADTEVFDLVRKTLAASNQNLNVIDYVDMIHLCLVLNVKFLWNELILVDEAQDLDPMQIEAIRRMANHRAQVVLVGDTNQAIYGFRGADVEAIETASRVFNTTSLPLSTCWRCPKSVIREAQTIVPEIEWAPNAIEGKVEHMNSHDEMMKLAEAGDYVLCRTTAPLVNVCMQFIRNGKAANVRGRDIHKGLEALATKIQKRRTSRGKGLFDALTIYREEALEKLNHPKKLQQRESLADRIDTLLVLAEECSNFDELKRKIATIFAIGDAGSKEETAHLILCSTAHRAKGLETERVFIIKPGLMPHPCARQPWQMQQERNLKYVAITRATRELYWVHESEEDGKAPKGPQDSPPTQADPQADQAPKKAPAKRGRPRKAAVK